jgi:hypothetical protein
MKYFKVGFTYGGKRWGEGQEDENCTFKVSVIVLIALGSSLFPPKWRVVRVLFTYRNNNKSSGVS